MLPATGMQPRKTHGGFARIREATVRGILFVVALLFVFGVSACGDCASARAEWQGLVKRAKVLACTSDSDCMLVGQTGTCDCSFSMAGNGVAVNAAAYQAAGGDKMLENYYTTCSGDKTGSWCCDCAPMSAIGCVNGQCAIVQVGRCGGGRQDGGALMSPADADGGNSADAAFDVPAAAYDSY